MKILVIDDEEDIQLLFKFKFKKEIEEGVLDFHFSLSAFEALNLLSKEEFSDLSLIISDINMPGMTGLELLNVIRKKFPKLKFYIISAYGDKKNIDLAKEQGVDEFLTKPINFDLLKEKIMS